MTYVPSNTAYLKRQALQEHLREHLNSKAISQDDAPGKTIKYVEREYNSRGLTFLVFEDGTWLGLAKLMDDPDGDSRLTCDDYLSSVHPLWMALNPEQREAVNQSEVDLGIESVNNAVHGYYERHQ